MDTHPEPPTIEGLIFRKPLARLDAGMLWRAEQLALERDVLVALLDTQDEGRLRLIRALAQVKTTLLPEVIDILDADGRTCVMTEDPHAQNIVSLLAGRRLDARQIVSLAMRLAEGLAALHGDGLLYAALCPARLYLSEDSEPVLPDITPARFEHGRGDNPAAWAPPACALPYAAPELHEAPDLADTRADMFALGLTLYALATGQTPFGAMPPDLLPAAKRERSIPSPCDISPNFPPALAAVLVALTQRDPADRFEDWDEVRFALHQSREGIAPAGADPAGSVIAQPDPSARARAGRTIRLSVRDLRAFRQELAARRAGPSWIVVALGIALSSLLAGALIFFLWCTLT